DGARHEDEGEVVRVAVMHFLPHVLEGELLVEPVIDERADVGEDVDVRHEPRPGDDAPVAWRGHVRRLREVPAHHQVRGAPDQRLVASIAAIEAKKTRSVATAATWNGSLDGSGPTTNGQPKARKMPAMALAHNAPRATPFTPRLPRGRAPCVPRARTCAS